MITDRYNQMLALLDKELTINDLVILTGMSRGAVQYTLANLRELNYVESSTPKWGKLTWKRKVASLTEGQLRKVRNAIDKNVSEPHVIPSGGRIVSFDSKEMQQKLTEAQRLRDRERKSRKVSIASTFEMVI